MNAARTLLLLGVSAVFLACGATPEPTPPAPVQNEQEQEQENEKEREAPELPRVVVDPPSGAQLVGDALVVTLTLQDALGAAWDDGLDWTLFYTLDGTDPRISPAGSGPSPLRIERSYETDSTVTLRYLAVVEGFEETLSTAVEQALYSLDVDEFVRGNPEIQSIHSIAFGPDGILLLGDGATHRIVAIRTGDTNAADASNNAFTSVTGIEGRAAQTWGGDAAILRDFAVNPISKKVYLAFERQSTGQFSLMTLNGAGQLSGVDLSDVRHAKLPYAAFSVEGIVTDIAWTESHVLATAMASDFSSAKVIAVPIPFRDGDASATATTRAYHISHGQWETRTPIDVFTSYEESGTQYLAAAFTCAPISRFSVSDWVAGGETTGVTPFDLGPFNQIQDLLFYEKDGVGYLMANVYDFGRRILWTGRVRRSLAMQSDTVDTDGPTIFNSNDAAHPSLHADAERIAAWDNVLRVVPLDSTRVVRQRWSGSAWDLQTAELP